MPSAATVNKYQKKPVVIDAVQFSQQSAGAIADWCGGKLANISEDQLNVITWALDIETLEGTMRATDGWWIIRGVEGEFYPCRDSVFVASYDLLSDVENQTA